MPQDPPGKGRKKWESKKKSDGEGDGRSMHNLQGKAGRKMLLWFREEKAAVREEQRTACTEKIVVKASGLVWSSYPMWEDGLMVQILHLRIQEDSPLHHCSKLRQETS